MGTHAVCTAYTDTEDTDYVNSFDFHKSPMNLLGQYYSRL